MSKSENQNPESPKGVNIHYQKTPGYRNVYVSGAFGGTSAATGLVYMSLFTDRPPIPKVVLAQVKDAEMNAENDMVLDGKDGIVREVEIGCIMDIRTTKALVQWLQHKVDVLEGRA